MALFSYQARDGRGELASGTVNALTLEEASRILRGEGKFIVQLAPASSRDAARASEPSVHKRARHVKRQDVINFANQISVMVQTGVPLSESLECAVDQATSPHFKAVLADVAAQVTAGGEFSAAMRRYPTVFPPIMTSLVRASEVSGTMGTMLERIAGYMTKEQQTVRQVKGAMMYPLFMMCMAVGVTIFLLAFVLPKFAAIYSNRGAALPAPTRLLLATSNGLVNFWYIWIALAVVLGVGLVVFMKTEFGRRAMDWLKLHLPIFKHLFTQLYVSRACRTMGTMVTAGVSMLDMVAIVKQVTENAYYEDLWDQVDEELRRGKQLSDPLFTSELIPRSVTTMILSGEKSGRLGHVLAKVAEFTEVEFERAVKTSTQFIEPLMIGVMGAIIGFVAISLLLPIFSIGTVVAN